jgi:predicted nucleotidyltransferase component of viral defense system
MIELTQADIRQHGKEVPWPNDLQVEQDLLLSHSMIALFRDEFLSKHIAMRGGTVLHKFHLSPPARYSEDIDLVVITDRDERHIAAAIKRTLRPVLGERVNSVFDKVVLSVRNALSASRILRMEYLVPSVASATIKIKIEANVSERHPFMAPVNRQFSLPFRGGLQQVDLVSFDINEMLGTKLRALFQRDAGRDLFDLYHARTGAGVDPKKIIAAFTHYMAGEKKKVRRADFVEALEGRMKAPAFRADMETLLRDGVDYDVDHAGAWIQENLLALLPDESGRRHR